ncbi:MAG TPA: histidine phosphatase family protein [Anaerolineae bacterium]|nr:histidine phosphatase family protein [Anaerolineae bacterium]HIQ04500.1 histidine phosphatase family protein [Anaerolineae bacterium]
MTTTMILVRHGRTAWNKEVRFRGREDLPLDHFGLRQAEAVGFRIAAEWVPTAIYTSPLRRAMQTAQAIASICELPVQPEPGLLDIDYGDWQGLSPAQAAGRDPDLHAAWLHAPHTVQIPGGENLGIVRERVTAMLARLLQKHGGETIVLVGHMVVNRVLLCFVLGLGDDRFWRLRQETAAINIIEHDGQDYTLVTLNDTCHLRAL